MPYRTSNDYQRMVELLDAGETLVYKRYASTRYWTQISGIHVGGRLVIYGYSKEKWIKCCKNAGTVFMDPAVYGDCTK